MKKLWRSIVFDITSKMKIMRILIGRVRPQVIIGLLKGVIYKERECDGCDGRAACWRTLSSLITTQSARKLLSDYSFNDLIREIARFGDYRVLYEKIVIYTKVDENVW